jgi:hypothetical protein
MLVMHHVSDHMGTGNSWFVNKKKFGHLKPHGSTNDPHLYHGVERVPNMYKLQDKDGKVVRPQENHALKLAEFIFRFCPPTGTMLVFCAGTLTTMLACFLLNRQGIFNDWDKECLELATVRAKLFLYLHMKHVGPSYPDLNVPNNSKDNLLIPYKAFGKPFEANPHPVEIPKTNIPVGYPTSEQAVAQFNEAYLLRVGPSRILNELPPGEVAEGMGGGLHAIGNFKKGDEICYWNFPHPG